MSIKIKEKKVELIELFYDLIYVYAISRLTLLIEEPQNGVIPVSGFLRYIVVCFVILQAWLYLTNYVNRYGRWKWYEYSLTAVNMSTGYNRIIDGILLAAERMDPAEDSPGA